MIIALKSSRDYPLIRAISPFTPLQRSVAIIAFQFVPGLAARKKRHRHRYIYRAHSHPGSDWNDLNAREAPEECRCAYTRARWFIRLGVVRSVCVREYLSLFFSPSLISLYIWRNLARTPVARHASIFINVTASSAIPTDRPYVLSLPVTLLLV